MKLLWAIVIVVVVYWLYAAYQANQVANAIANTIAAGPVTTTVLPNGATVTQGSTKGTGGSKAVQPGGAITIL